MEKPLVNPDRLRPGRVPRTMGERFGREHLTQPMGERFRRGYLPRPMGEWFSSLLKYLGRQECLPHQMCISRETGGPDIPVWRVGGILQQAVSRVRIT